MVQHIDGRHLWINAELLGKIAQHFADLVFLREDVDAVEIDGAGVGILERGDGAHQRAFAGAVWAEEAEHIVADGEREVLERPNAVRIGLRQASDRKCHARLAPGTRSDSHKRYAHFITRFYGPEEFVLSVPAGGRDPGKDPWPGARMLLRLEQVAALAGWPLLAGGFRLGRKGTAQATFLKIGEVTQIRE